MSNSNLDFLIRKNKGKSLLNQYHDMFLQAGFDEDELIHIDLKASDDLISEIKAIFSVVEEQKVEILPKEANYLKSALLSLMLVDGQSSSSYIFSDDVHYCGMYMASNSSILRHCLNLARYGYSNTCFILDGAKRFSFTINFYDSSNAKLKDHFDIQLKTSTGA